MVKFPAWIAGKIHIPNSPQNSCEGCISHLTVGNSFKCMELFAYLESFTIFVELCFLLCSM